MINKFYSIIILLSQLMSSDYFFENEKLYYTAGFRFIPAGEAILSFTNDTLYNKPVYKLTTSVKTNSFLDKFYEVRDNIQSWLEPENLSLIKIIQSIREGSYHIDHQSEIKGDSIVSNKSITSDLYLSDEDLNPKGSTYPFIA